MKPDPSLKVHPAADLFPLLSDAELRDLAASIKAEGLLNLCVKQGNVLLDGRNRLAACKLAGVTPRFVDYTGDSPVAFIIATNLQRRHLDKGQKIALALDLEPFFAAEARKRQEAGRVAGGYARHGDHELGGKSPTKQKSRNQPQSQKSGKCPTFRKGESPRPSRHCRWPLRQAGVCRQGD